VSRPRVLITGTVTSTVIRRDILEMFGSLAGAAELTFVEYDWGDAEFDGSAFDRFGELTTWEAEGSADALLARVRPDRVALLFNSSRNQVALRAAARDRGVETVHVEHGYRLPADDAPAALFEHGPRIGDARASGVRTHAFFARSLLRRRPRVAAGLVRYGVAVARAGGATPEVLREFADLRRPDRYVSYSQECFDFHRDIDRVPPGPAPASFSGVPQFDDFRVSAGADPRPEALLVDHMFHNAGLFGWDERFRREWVDRIAQAVFAAGFERLHVKPHPGDRSGAWEPYAGDERVRVVGRDELAELSGAVSVVLGTWSTMQMPFAAQPQIATISLEIHPEPDRFPSRRFVEAGVAEPVRDFAELTARLREADALARRQRAAKPAFTKRFLERLDGGAGKRMAAALVGR
jgi:hypothetical protein